MARRSAENRPNRVASPVAVYKPHATKEILVQADPSTPEINATDSPELYELTQTAIGEIKSGAFEPMP